MITNEQSVELFNILSQLQPEKGSHQEMARAKTLRNMKEWSSRHTEKIQDIRDKYVATKDVDGVKVIMKEKINITNKNSKGEENTTEELVPMYTQEGLQKIKEETREYLKMQVSPSFEIYSTYDDGGLNAYQKEILTEYGFLLSKELFDAKVTSKNEKKDEQQPTNA